MGDFVPEADRRYTVLSRTDTHHARALQWLIPI